MLTNETSPHPQAGRSRQDGCHGALMMLFVTDRNASPLSTHKVSLGAGGGGGAMAEVVRMLTEHAPVLGFRVLPGSGRKDRGLFVCSVCK